MHILTAYYIYNKFSVSQILHIFESIKMNYLACWKQMPVPMFRRTGFSAVLVRTWDFCLAEKFLEDTGTVS